MHPEHQTALNFEQMLQYLYTQHVEYFFPATSDKVDLLVTILIYI